jgi:hypothetical protein
MRLGNLVYDIAAIAKHYSMDASKVCWPVLLSTKSGDARLTNCAHWGQAGHDGKASSAHLRPKSFNIDYIVKHFTAKAANAGDKRKLPKK